jgi:hypothetical protein
LAQTFSARFVGNRQKHAGGFTDGAASEAARRARPPIARTARRRTGAARPVLQHRVAAPGRGARAPGRQGICPGAQNHALVRIILILIPNDFVLRLSSPVTTGNREITEPILSFSSLLYQRDL